ncbi:nucleoporin POM33 [Colletotrichum spaethianum]|uniref:Nucleoporin POM33 n=1 Tax=Colletotrichum spaethianum TaxID=700344 RepID=A0AA37LJP1_9PEZI|nr:nucleoporin POM33 [Colletotrichum spaethianum]GKT45327.1 nucleoporin POM33 [Colletotrichum spaethianum]
MAPPPPANIPLTQRLLLLAQTLQYSLLLKSGRLYAVSLLPDGSRCTGVEKPDGLTSGDINTLLTGRRLTHLSLIFAVIRYGLSYVSFNYYSRVARFSYRLTFLSAALTYGIVVYKTLRARSKAGAKAPTSPLALVADENVQYLGMSLVWLLSPQYPLAMLPYAIYSIFHVATYTRANVIPTITPPKPITPASGASPSAKPQYAHNPIADKIGAFVKEYYDASMSVVSSLEILLWVRLLLSAITFQRRSWILIAIYTAFLRARFAQSTHVQNSLALFESRVDSAVGNQGTPPAARQAWETVKGGARQFYAYTDPNRYLSGASVPKKTS